MSFGAPNVEKPSPAYHGNYDGSGMPSAHSMPNPQPYVATQQSQGSQYGPKPGTHPPQYYQPQHQTTSYQAQPQNQPQMIYVQPQRPPNKRKDDDCCSCAFLAGCCAGLLCCPCLLCC